MIVSMGVVEIEQVGRDRIDERRTERIGRSGRPMMTDVAAPLNGDNVRSADVTADQRAEPSAVAKKFRIDRLAS
jgi:hypothetical protein